MIARHLEMRDARKSRIARLVDYITSGVTGERVGAVRVTNCLSDPNCMQACVAEMLATQECNQRTTKDKTFHLLVSFRPGEALPPDDVLAAIEERLCVGIGFAGHQRISAVHTDTDNVHLHIAINKIHPERLTIHEPYRAYDKMARICEALEAEYGLQIDNHAARKCPSENRADDMERHSGLESLVGWIKRSDLPAQLEAAESWEQLHALCQENGLSARLQGNGLVFEADNGITVKASTVSRKLSKAKLEARLGAFVPAPDRQQVPKQRQYQVRPVPTRVDTSALYARYQVERDMLATTRRQVMDALRRERQQRVDDLMQSNRARRERIRRGPGGRWAKRVLYSHAHQALRAELDKIHAEHRRLRQATYERTRRPIWADWLKVQAMQGDEEALAALRAREGRSPLSGDTLSGNGMVKPGWAPRAVNITKKGTILYRIGAAAVRDDGERLQVSDQGIGNRTVCAEALRLAMARYGNRIAVGGCAQFREQILRIAVENRLAVQFGDEALERRRRELMAAQSVREKQAHQENRRPRGRGR